MTKDIPHRLPLLAFSTHPRLQPRGGVTHTVVRSYAAAMRKGEEFPPILAGRVGSKLYVIDGHHRLEAAALAGLPTIAAHLRSYRTLEAAQRAALQCNQAHGKRMTNAEKQAAFAAYIEHGLHIWGDDDLSKIAGVVKPLRQIAHECPVYDFRTIGRKLKELGIDAEREDTLPFDPHRFENEDGPSEADLAEDEAIALSQFHQHIDAAAASYGLLGEKGRASALERLSVLENALQSRQSKLLDI